MNFIQEKYKGDYICLDDVLGTSIDLMKGIGFKLAKERSWWYPAQTIMDYADDIALLSNTPAQVESQLHSLERAAGGLSFHVNDDKQNTCALIKEVISPH